LFAGQVPIDEGVPELPLRAGELEPVALEGRFAGTAPAEALPLGDEDRDPRRELVCARAGAAAPESRRPQGPK
jgi:hypothetical protein